METIEALPLTGNKVRPPDTSVREDRRARKTLAANDGFRLAMLSRGATI